MRTGQHSSASQDMPPELITIQRFLDPKVPLSTCEPVDPGGRWRNGRWRCRFAARKGDSAHGRVNLQGRTSEARCSQVRAPNVDVVCDLADSPTNSRQYRILCYGDSLTAGFCSKGKHFEPYGPFLARALKAAGIGCEVVVCGLNGFTAQHMLDQLKSSSVQDITGKIGRGLSHFLDGETRHDLVVLMAGTNDLAVDKPDAKRVFERLRKLHEVCHARGVHTVALTPAGPMPTRHRAARLELRSLLMEWARVTPGVVGIADCEELVPRSLQRGCELWDPDDIHMKPEGSRTFGQGLLRVVSGALRHVGGEKSKRPNLETRAKTVASRACAVVSPGSMLSTTIEPEVFLSPTEPFERVLSPRSTARVFSASSTYSAGYAGSVSIPLSAQRRSSSPQSPSGSAEVSPGVMSSTTDEIECLLSPSKRSARSIARVLSASSTYNAGHAGSVSIPLSAQRRSSSPQLPSGSAEVSPRVMSSKTDEIECLLSPSKRSARSTARVLSASSTYNAGYAGSVGQRRER